MLESYGLDVVSSGPLNEQFLGSLELTPHDVLLVDRLEDEDSMTTRLTEMLNHWDEPVLFNDSTATRLSLQQGNPEFGQSLANQIASILPGPEET